MFTYDSVYEPNCSTEEVYEQSAKDRVLSAMQARPQQLESANPGSSICNSCRSFQASCFLNV